MNINNLVVGPIEVNCYVLTVDDKLYIIDPGGSSEKIISKVRSMNKQVECILLTHGHIDHISAVKAVSEAFDNIPVYLHSDDLSLYLSRDNSLPPIYPALIDPVKPINSLSETDFKIIHTPGHSKGSVCFYFEKDGVLFSGDTLFCESIGRSDLPGGDHATLINSIKNEIMVLDSNTIVYPGHGPKTTINNEKKYNPFLK